MYGALGQAAQGVEVVGECGDERQFRIVVHRAPALMVSFAIAARAASSLHKSHFAVLLFPLGGGGMAFRVGQKVVCVDASANPEYGHNGLVEGRIYVVRGIRSEIPNPPHWGVYIEGIPGHWRLPIGEIPFHPRRFRPIAERKTNISIFEEMLTSAPNELKQVD